ncbi:hypothetical protein GCK72_007765 [Caenorhabditis remanei]|uniref:Uncharacterized protein n=1 Tax=Caenorhabditis remanei TaxID=31234 RepID=A0A6A5HMA6_CAERE|nr:hypothetical protein GCK72_007765 [Caenorhabditis remanei]KAF1767806.1 hypothetical protein GCK72_007765 [Caenorhabditis remanei]
MSIPKDLEQLVAKDLETEMPADQIERGRKFYNDLSSEQKDAVYKLFKGSCNKYFDTESYKNGKTNTAGHLVCCHDLGMCGTSGWLIFLIILIVLLCLAGAAAAFWFFYYKRKIGGRDEEKEIESTADTANTEHDISVETY